MIAEATANWNLSDSFIPLSIVNDKRYKKAQHFEYSPKPCLLESSPFIMFCNENSSHIRATSRTHWPNQKRSWIRSRFLANSTSLPVACRLMGYSMPVRIFLRNRNVLFSKQSTKVDQLTETRTAQGPEITSTSKHWANSTSFFFLFCLHLTSRNPYTTLEKPHHSSFQCKESELERFGPTWPDLLRKVFMLLSSILPWERLPPFQIRQSRGKSSMSTENYLIRLQTKN